MQGLLHSAVGSRLSNTHFTPNPPIPPTAAMSASQNQVKSYGFGLKALKKFPEVLPLVSIMGVATVGVGAFCLYALFEKTDVKINRSELARWDTIDVNQPQKVRQASDRHCLLHLVYSFIHLWYRFAGMLRV
ncbi:uncharacterized protein LOC122246437 isoform X2 [Penaeus japonicus]|uniref:uncharacterized protein LOC122246437 isoform X2 n=1 Tax=Penaeus japonicus TaxID=27405 RepID=UPI001C711088|nr:uncharacterized protein LOC122246437 isoform X2 [Penaeus japonicus]